MLRLFRQPRDAMALAREAAAMTAARALLPLVPAVIGMVEVDGRPGMIMERIDGPDLLTSTGKKPWWVWKAGRINGEVQARLNEVPAPHELPTLRQRITTMVSSPLVPQPVAAFALRELEELPEGWLLCHGDLHPANILLSSRGPIVIDWPNATRGDPHADYARTRLMLRIGSLPPGSPLLLRAIAGVGRKVLGRSYDRAYRRTRSGAVDMELVRRWEIVRCADRLAENIPEERPVLLAILDAAGATS